MPRILGLPELTQRTNGTGIRQTAVRPPNLSDPSIKGVYSAAMRVPSSVVENLNRVSTRIGAPALSGGKPATAIQMPAGGGGDPRPYLAHLPSFARAIGARSRTFLATTGARLRRIPKRY